MKSLLRKGVAFSVFALASSLSGAALAIPFTITSASFSVDTTNGYGAENNNTEDNAPNLLEVYFSTAAFAGFTTNLNLGQTSASFNFGTVDFQEPNRNNGIAAITEQDNLNVQAIFTFTQPGAGTQTVTAIGTAIVGPINDPMAPGAVDYTINWGLPLTVTFGTGGSYLIDLADLSFSQRGMQNASATITYVTADRTQNGTVPEPGSLALAGLGMIAAIAARRRKH